MIKELLRAKQEAEEAELRRQKEEQERLEAIARAKEEEVGSVLLKLQDRILRKFSNIMMGLKARTFLAFRPFSMLMCT